MTDATDTPSPVQLLGPADERLVRTVDGLCADPDALAAPSLLPRWSRAHVVAHVALNGEGIARMLEGLQAGEPTTMYDSDEARDADIDELAGADASVLRDRLFASVSRVREAFGHLTPEQEGAQLERTPGGTPIHVPQLPLMRLTEVEVHHADLDRGYTAQDWSPEFCTTVLERFSKRPERASVPFLAAPDDLLRSWEYGDPGAQPITVSGPAWALAWWVTGRGHGEHLTSSTGVLPRIGAI